MKIDKLEVEVEYTMNEPTFPESIMDQYKQAMREVLEERNKIQVALNLAMRHIDYSYDNEHLNVLDFIHAVQVSALETKNKIIKS